MPKLGLARWLRRIKLPLAAKKLATLLFPSKLATVPMFETPDLAAALAALEVGETRTAHLHLRPLALQGVAEAEYRMGILCLHGVGVVQDFGDAVFWLTRAADRRHGEAQSELGMAYVTGSATPAPDSSLVRWQRIAAQAHGPVAKANLMLLHPNGLGLECNVAKGLVLLEAAAAQGVASAQLRLGSIYDDAAYGLQDHGAALAWYQAAAMQGNVEAQFKLGALYARMQDAKQDFSAAIGWFHKAAEQGHVVAMFNLGLMYAQAYGCERDIAAAIHWYQKAADAGDPNAQFNLGLIYANGLAGQHDYAAAIDCFVKAAERGNVSAQFNLGLLYANGIGCPRNIAEATIWYRKAAGAGSGVAQVNLGLLHLDPSNPAYDAEEARVWFLRAAEHGNVLALVNLAALYSAGNGVRRDDAEAARLFALAAEQGNLTACIEFARMILDGRTAPTDRIRAYCWLKRTIEGLRDDRQREYAQSIMVELAANMSEADIEQGKALAAHSFSEAAFT